MIDGVIYLIDHPDCTVPELMQFIKGPDFPTGGIVLGKSGIYDAYTTGRGRIIVRAKTEIEPMAANRSRIIVTELPYMVNKARLIEKIAELVHDKRCDGISDIRDESDRHGMRIVIELKRDVNAAVVLNYLYKHTQLQDTFGAIMLALVDGKPKTLTLKEALSCYVKHQEDVIRRRSEYDLERAKARAHILEGLLIAQDNIDEVVRIIRASKSANEARPQLMERFGLTEKAGAGHPRYAPLPPDGLGARAPGRGAGPAARDDCLFKRSARQRADGAGHHQDGDFRNPPALRRRAAHGADGHGRRD